jgi:hypothetical protein
MQSGMQTNTDEIDVPLLVGGANQVTIQGLGDRQH